MSKPTLEDFIASIRRALEKVYLNEEELAVLDEKGALFDLEEDGFVDSTDMLDVLFFVDKDLNIKIDVEKLMYKGDPLTVQNLYDVIREEEKAPA